MDASKNRENTSCLLENPLGGKEVYRTLVELAQDIIYIVDTKGYLIFTNGLAASGIGLTKEEAVGKSLDEVFPKDISRIMCGYLEEIVKTRKPIDVDNDLVLQGRELVVSTRLIPLKNQNGEVTAVMGFSRDITERKRLEETISRARDELEEKIEERIKELREANLRLRTLAANIPGVIYQFRLAKDWTMSFPFISEGVKDLIGFEAVELQNSPWKAFEPIHPDDLESVNLSIGESSRALKTWFNEIRLKKRAGEESAHEEYKWVRATSYPQLESDGGILWTGIALDVTEEKKRRRL